MRKLSEIDAVLTELQDTLAFPVEQVSRAHAHDLAKSGRNLISYATAKGDPLTLHEAEKEGWDNVVFYWHKAIEKSPASVTHKGYDTTGVKAQFIVNALNRVLGLDGWEEENTFEKTEIVFGRSKKEGWHVTCRTVLRVMFENDVEGREIDGKRPSVWSVYRQAWGEHTSIEKGSALKGAQTNAFKKVASLVGCGAIAYEKTLDEDAAPLPAKPEETAPARTPQGRVAGTGRAEPEPPLKTEEKGEGPIPEGFEDADETLKKFWSEVAKFIGKIPDWERGVVCYLRTTNKIDLIADSKQTPARDAALQAFWKVLRDLDDATRKATVENAIKLDEMAAEGPPAEGEGVPFGDA